MEKSSTLLLKAVVLFIGVAVLIFCILTFPMMWRSENTDYLPVFLVINLSAFPFFFAVYQVIKLLNYVDTNKPFSDLSVKALKNIKYSALIFAAIYILGIPYIYYKAEVDDAPGVLAITIILTLASIIIGTFAAVLQNLIQKAVDLKSENDLTV